MICRYDGSNWLVRLDRGEKLIESLKDLIKKHALPNCWVSGIGGSSQVELGFYHLDKKQYAFKTIEGLLEIVSLQGNIVGGHTEPQIHLHGSFSGEDYMTLGGHVKELIVGGTCELFLHQWHGDSLTRQCDEATGLNLLQL